jgi:hypothetical protein
MININKMTEAQVRYLLNELLDVSPSNTTAVSMLMLEDSYPQNNEESVDE